MAFSSNSNIRSDVEAISRIDVVPNILEVICRITGMGFAAIARVTEDRWVACSVRDEIDFGLKPGGELKVETTICHEIRQHKTPVLIDHVSEDETYARHFTPAMYGFQSYISVPITRKDGTFFGTLCAIDTKPALVNTPEVKDMFKLFADLIAFHLNTIENLEAAELSLAEERKTAELREQFIAILGHDLRNPIGAVLNAAQALLRMPLDERMERLSNIIQDSSYRIKALIENIMDFAQGRMGDGIKLNRQDNEPVKGILNQVITELCLIWPNCEVQTSFVLNEPVNCDGKRLAQLFSNLLGNAITHGNKDKPIIVNAKSDEQHFTLMVCNSGSKIPEAVMGQLFQPFSRGNVKPGQQGLGLGLYIAWLITEAHNGTLTAKSTEKETCFILQIPNYHKIP